jgi:hypothetical protein
MTAKQALDTVYVFSDVASRRTTPGRAMKRATGESERRPATAKSSPSGVGMVPLDIL